MSETTSDEANVLWKQIDLDRSPDWNRRLIEAALRRERNKTREECAKICSAIHSSWKSTSNEADKCAVRIRATIEPED